MPSCILEEIEKIKYSKQLKGNGSNVVAAKELVNYSKVGRELERMMNNVSGGLLPIPHKKKKRGLF